MDRARIGWFMFAATCAIETVALVTGAMYTTTTTIVVLAAIAVILPSTVGYLIARWGAVYDLVLGIMPGIFAMDELPTDFLCASRVGAAMVSFSACVIAAAIGAAGGQRVAMRRAVDHRR